MTDPHSGKPDLRRRLVAPFGDDAEELRRMRAEFLSELADWILSHPLPADDAHGARPPDAPPGPGRPGDESAGRRRSRPPLDDAAAA